MYTNVSSSCHADSTDFLDFSLSLYPYHTPLPAGFPKFILCLHRADGNKFLLAHPCVGVYRRASLMSLYLKIQMYITDKIVNFFLAWLNLLV